MVIQTFKHHELMIKGLLIKAVSAHRQNTWKNHFLLARDVSYRIMLFHFQQQQATDTLYNPSQSIENNTQTVKIRKSMVPIKSEKALKWMKLNDIPRGKSIPFSWDPLPPRRHIYIYVHTLDNPRTCKQPSLQNPPACRRVLWMFLLLWLLCC